MNIKSQHKVSTRRRHRNCDVVVLVFLAFLQIHQDVSLCGSLHVLPDQHGHCDRQIQVHRQVTKPSGQYSGGRPGVPCHRHHLPPPRVPHRLQDQAGADEAAFGE